MTEVDFDCVKVDTNRVVAKTSVSADAPDDPLSRPWSIEAMREYLSEPRSKRDVAKRFAIDVPTAFKRIGEQLARGTIVRVAYGRFARADCFEAAPDSQLVRPRPVYDALLAYLVEPRRAVEIASHIASTVPIATGHMARLMRQGVVVRVAYGVYVRQDKCPRPPDPKTIQRGCPTRDKVAALIDGEMSLDAIVKAAGLRPKPVRDHLARLLHDRVIERVGQTHYRPLSPELFE